jgi:hypothetical protein
MNSASSCQFICAVCLLLSAMAAKGSDRKLPDPLLTAKGERIDASDTWEKQRRGEILELFREHVYGRAPVGRPDNLRFETIEITTDAMDGMATRKLVKVVYEGPGGQGAMRLVLFVPNRAARPAPCFLLICNRDESNIDPTRAVKSSFWPAEEIIARGYAAAAFQVNDVDPDRPDGFERGVRGIYHAGGERQPDSWGTIAAWAWGASRAVDYFETDRSIDARRIIVIGHSRGGKAALWAGAEDRRFAMVVSNNSGSTGAALARGKKGERVSDINTRFPHWFCWNYRRYNGREEELPVDQHMLAALIAPRLLYIASATEDTWADPPSEFMAAVHASPVYKLYGLEGVSAEQMPPPDSPLHKGRIGYHLRTGGHNLLEYDWGRFMDFADKQL